MSIKIKKGNAEKESTTKNEVVETGSVDRVIGAVNKKFGKGSFRRLGDDDIISVPVIPTGSYPLDKALGVGGYPRGRVVEVYGPESSGKTTIALHAIAMAQKQGGMAAFIDAEHALDTAYASNIGVNVDDLCVSQPDCGETGLEILDYIVRSGAFDIAVVDSVAALVPRAELEGEMGDAHMGLQARLMGQAMRKLTSAVSRSNTCVIFINQLRQKIGVMFGNPETTTGGNALKFYSSIRLDIRRIGAIKSGDEEIGNRVRIKVAKNKLAPPFKKIETEILFGKGFNTSGEIVDAAVALGIIEQSGSWYSYGEQRLGQGRLNVCDLLNSDKELLDKIAADIALEGEA